MKSRLTIVAVGLALAFLAVAAVFRTSFETKETSISPVPGTTVESDEITANLERQFSGTVHPFLKLYCAECHGGTHPEADFDLNNLSSMAAVLKDIRRASLVLERLEASDMPPRKAKLHPPAEARREAIAWFQAVRDRETQRNAGDPGIVLAHRLSNAEYNYTIRDLTGVDLKPTREFPVDPANMAGFDNSGESLAMSPALLKKYLDAAHEVSSHLFLRPKGLAFAPHPMLSDMDRDKYCVMRIIDFYHRQEIDYGNYFQAAWRYKYRAALGKPQAKLADIAAENKVSSKYLMTVWSILEDTKKEEVGPIAKLRSMWSALPPPSENQADMARKGAEKMRDFVVQLRKKVEPRFLNISAGMVAAHALPFVMWKNRQYATHRMTFDPAQLQVDGEPSRTLTNAPEPGTNGLYWPGPTLFVKNTPGDPDLAVPAGQRSLNEAAFARFCRVFPDKFYMEERGPNYFDTAKDKVRFLSAGFTSPQVHQSLMGYFRDDQPLYELILDNDQQKELDEMWLEMEFVAKSTTRMYIQAYRTPDSLFPGRAPLIDSKLTSAEAEEMYTVSTLAWLFRLSSMLDVLHVLVGAIGLIAFAWGTVALYKARSCWLLKVAGSIAAGWILLLGVRSWLDEIPTEITSETHIKKFEAHTVALATNRNAGRPNATNEVPIKAIKDYFKCINDAIRATEKARSQAEPTHLDALLQFAARAYRRPLSQEEKADLLTYYKSCRDKDGFDHETAIRESIVTVLMSPEFCYRIDLLEPAMAVAPLSDFELASRLSYFLWSSMPDDELVAHAAAGDLHEPKIIVGQARRMLRDPRIRALAVEFGGNWLDFRRFEEIGTVDRERFPSFTDALRQAMFEEPIRFLVDVFQTNRSVLDLVYADDTFVNPILATHYGIPVQNGRPEEWARIEHANRYDRGGLLPMAVFLTKNAPGARTSPVKRGNWLVKNVLGERIPPPPPAVPELPHDEAKLDLPLRDLLARHRTDPNCAACHARFDSVGLAFEGYGPIGQRRDKDLAGRPVDASALFPGVSQGAGLEGLRQYIRDRRQNDFVDNFCGKLLAFALARSPVQSDKSMIQQMRGNLARHGYQFSAAIETIVTSPQFLNKRGRDDRNER
jgi:hypothetical protein